MSRTRIHKEEGKFRNEVIGQEDVSERLRRKWHRHNADVGEFRSLRKIKLEKCLDRIVEKLKNQNCKLIGKNLRKIQ